MSSHEPMCLSALAAACLLAQDPVCLCIDRPMRIGALRASSQGALMPFRVIEAHSLVSRVQTAQQRYVYEVLVSSALCAAPPQQLSAVHWQADVASACQCIHGDC